MNVAYVDVTVCVPGNSGECQTFDHVLVDTQSYGLRILADATDVDGNALSIPLPAETQNETGEPLAECTVFADGYSWGPLFTADITISGETATGIPMEIIGASNYTNVPSDCQTADVNHEEDTVAAFEANGIVGVGPFVQDCGEGCTQGGGASPTYYYVCSSPTSCTDSYADVSQQVSNPVYYFPVDDNGVIVELPPVPPTGASSVTGALVFGIGTEDNNELDGATVLGADPGDGSITTTFNGQVLADSFFDSGSNGYFFDDSSITQCSQNSGFTGFFCPSSTLSLSAVLTGCTNCGGVQETVDFSVANPQSFFAPLAAANDLAGSLGSGFKSPDGVFDWGLPFYFGRNVFTAIYGMNTPAGEGPYYAF